MTLSEMESHLRSFDALRIQISFQKVESPNKVIVMVVKNDGTNSLCTGETSI